MTHSTGTLTGMLRAAGLAALVGLAACDDDPLDPTQLPDVRVEASATEFAEIDLAIGTSEPIFIVIRNEGDGPLSVHTIEVEGSDARAFTITGGGQAGMLAAGTEHEVTVTFTPDTQGTKRAVVAIGTNDPARGRVEIPIRGQAARFQYRQVDRMGIPGLNTVFNHPSGIGPFDKTAYNLASPADDVASYTGLFETVLGAVANPDPQGTAALLLPDELPVALGAVTAFGDLTGRALSDDAVDVALSVTVGIDALKSDNVDGNDKEFLTVFPYVAPPHN